LHVSVVIIGIMVNLFVHRMPSNSSAFGVCDLLSHPSRMLWYAPSCSSVRFSFKEGRKERKKRKKETNKEKRARAIFAPTRAPSLIHFALWTGWPLVTNVGVCCVRSR